jgi:hypothetical protein
MGDHFPGTSLLAEFDTLLAAQLADSSTFVVLALVSLFVRAVVVIVIDIPMLGQVLKRLRVIWGTFAFGYSLDWKLCVSSFSTGLPFSLKLPE